MEDIESNVEHDETPIIVGVSSNIDEKPNLSGSLKELLEAIKVTSL